jgi:hypothetical protein
MSGTWQRVSIGTALSWVMKLFMIALLFYYMAVGDYLFAVANVVAIAVSLAPSFIQRNYRITLPFELDLLVTLAIFLHIYFGEELMFYERIGAWDVFLHFFSTAVLSLIGFMFVYTLHYTGKLRLTIPMIGYFTFFFALSMGALWEILEFAVDSAFDTTAQETLSDTMWDLIVDSISALGVSLFAMTYVRYVKPAERKRMTRPIGDALGIPERYYDRVKQRRDVWRRRR